MLIEFTRDEMIRWAEKGVARCAHALTVGRKGAHGFNRDHERWQIDVEGVLAEAAVAKALGIEYEPVVGELDTESGDLGRWSNVPVQVRSTKYQTGSLLIHDRDPDDHRFVLVTGIYGTYQIRGWIYAKEGKKKNLWKEYKGRGAYWVPQSALREFDPAVVAGWL